ncbi:hypothetical protein [Pseudomonas fluorescens]|uniref:hypothetical protein n=1 Tax=Pseudomonas fluorescens TaxID=294 RepID=UPI0005C7638E|nr:hypothetical protein [Pseudomonas fluorescens]
MSEVKVFKCVGYMEQRSRAGGERWVSVDDFDRVTAERDALQALLTAADERADTATSLVQRYVDNFDTEIEYYEDIQPNDLEHDQVLAEMRLFLAALKPEPSGGDAARLALRPENQRITPARFKCLACGEYHEGPGNLPCPSMSPYSRIEQ